LLILRCHLVSHPILTKETTGRFHSLSFRTLLSILQTWGCPLRPTPHALPQYSDVGPCLLFIETNFLNQELRSYVTIDVLLDSLQGMTHPASVDLPRGVVMPLLSSRSHYWACLQGKLARDPTHVVLFPQVLPQLCTCNLLDSLQDMTHSAPVVLPRGLSHPYSAPAQVSSHAYRAS
jgi:hypothetical protein